VPGITGHQPAAVALPTPIPAGLFAPFAKVSLAADHLSASWVGRSYCPDNSYAHPLNDHEAFGWTDGRRLVVKP
jgi:hypothetical protein